jgi:SAM-dependent methyltransferase
MARLLRSLRRRLGSLQRAGVHRFERGLGIDTTGIIEDEELYLAEPEREGYQGSGWIDLRRMLRPGEVKPHDVFVDLGSGKGKVVLLAARYPFARVIGVEISEQLNEIARRNLAAARGRRRAKQVELVTSDVLEYEIPHDATVVYLYNPFRGSLFDAVIAKLIASVDRNPRTVRLIYLNPKEHDRLMATGRFRLERKAGRLRVRRNEAARSYIRMYLLEPA